MSDQLENQTVEKGSPEVLTLDPPKKKITQLNRKLIGAGAGTLGALLVLALTFGLDTSNRQRRGEGNEPTPQMVSSHPSDRVNELPSDYAGAMRKPLPTDPQMQPRLMADLQPSAGGSREEIAALQAQQRMDQEALKSDIFFVKPEIEQKISNLSVPALPVKQEGTAGYAMELPDYAGQNMQSQKLAFLNEFAMSDVYLEQPYQAPVSQYEVKAGTMISAALVTAVNSDLPGDVIAQVTENIYDTVTGRYLLIPQGAKLYGKYDSVVAYGQDRALVIWQRLIMPNGYSIQLDGMIAADKTGASGLSDMVDYHMDKLAGGVLLSTAISWAGNLADDDGGNSLNDVGATVAQESSRVGQEITRRNLDVQPTITIRHGYPVRVLVNRDMILSPYRF